MIEQTGQLISIIEAQEARIAELEGQQKPPDTGLKGRKPPTWIKANQPAHPRKELKKRGPLLCPAAGGANTPGGARHDRLP